MLLLQVVIRQVEAQQQNSESFNKGTSARQAANKVVHCPSTKSDCPNNAAYNKALGNAVNTKSK